MPRAIGDVLRVTVRSCSESWGSLAESITLLWSRRREGLLLLLAKLCCAAVLLAWGRWVCEIQKLKFSLTRNAVAYVGTPQGWSC